MVANKPNSMETKRAPKRRNLEQTRGRILVAAAAVFAEAGFGKTSLREIARRADVAPSLVSRYFGTKAALIEEVLLYVIEANSLFAWDKDRFGTEMTQLISRQGNANITVMLVLALADPEARAIAARVSQEQMIQPLAHWLGPPDAHGRAVALFSLMTGFVVQMEAFRRAPIPQDNLAWLANMLQAVVDGRALQ